MAFYTFKNAKLKINDRELFATDCNINTDASLDPKFLTDHRHAFTYQPSDVIEGTVDFSYYLTGNDPIKDFLEKESEDTFSGNFAGLNFASGYLSSYSVNGNPNEAVRAQAQIVFYDELKGTFSPTNTKANSEDFLNLSDVTVENLNQPSLGSIGDIVNFSYDYSTSISRDTDIDDFVPQRIQFGQKEVLGQFEIETISNELPISGKEAGLKITLDHPAKSITEDFRVSGILTSRQIQSSVGDRIRHNIQIRQDYTDLPPQIDGFNPTSGEAGDLILITGSRLKNTNEVFFNETEDPDFTVISDTEVSGVVPDTMVDGPIKINTFGGTATSSSDFDFIDNGLFIDSVSPLTGSKDDLIEISGSGFFEVSNVEFSAGKSGDFSVISTSIINAEVPEDAAYDFITVTSDKRNVSDTSSEKFSPIPRISQFTPTTGLIDDTITISGNSLSGVTGVEFNNIEANSFDVIKNIEVTATVPSGNTLGKIKLLGERDVSTTSDSKFFPEVLIDRLEPNAAKIGEDIVISGEGFFEEILDGSDLGNNQFRVKFTGDTDSTGAFELLDSERLSGSVPELSETGPVRIFRIDGGLFAASGGFSLVEGPLTFISLEPTGQFTGQSIIINGTQFHDITDVNLSGVNDDDIGVSFDSFTVDQSNEEIYAVVPATGVGDYRVFIQSDNGDVLSHGNSGILEILADLTAGVSGFIGDPPDTRTGINYGTFDVISPADVHQSHTGKFINDSDFGMELDFPSISGWQWSSRPTGKAAQIEIDPNDNVIVRLSIAETGNMAEVTETGRWRSFDGFDGIFDINILNNA